LNFENVDLTALNQKSVEFGFYSTKLDVLGRYIGEIQKISVVSVPEPQTIVLLSFALLLFFRFRLCRALRNLFKDENHYL